MIGQAVLATLLPARRLRYSNRNVKCTTSRYHARDDGRPALSTGIVAITIAVHPPPMHPTPSARPLHPFRHRPHAPRKPSTPPVPTRRQLVTAILLSQPRRDWDGWELAEKLQIKQHNLLTQLSEWARLGFLRRTGAGTYALDTPPTNWSPDHPADQLTAHSPGAITALDGDEERDKAQRPQQSENERPCTAASAVHTHPTPASDTPSSTASWT